MFPNVSIMFVCLFVGQDYWKTTDQIWNFKEWLDIIQV